MQEAFCWSWVQEQVDRSIILWNQSATPLVLNGQHYSKMDQCRREGVFQKQFAAAERQIKSNHRSRTAYLDLWDRLTPTFACLAEIVMELEPEAISLITNHFLPAGREFTRQAKQFDANLGMADVMQACRSAWTACGLQMMLGDCMEISPAILAYSLLYPYSDNYLDSTDVSVQIKLGFSERFKSQLNGHKLPANNQREAAIWALVAMIEEQFTRVRYPQVYECLLAIHRAQEESIAQQHDSGRCSDLEILRISSAKGGTSVLTDACLAHGWLSEEESRFAFLWGVLLQLGDDLQDVREDLQRGSATVFTRAVTMGRPLDASVIQLLNFSDHVTEEMNNLPSASHMLRRVMRSSWRSLITGAVAESHELFTPAFLGKAENASPFRFHFLREHRARFTKQWSQWGDSINEAAELHMAAG